MREPEPETIARARAGDPLAFESIVRASQGDVWRFAYHLTRDRSAADDVTQEAFLHAFRALPSYRGQSKFTSWLLRITRNCAIDAYRRGRRESAAPPEEVAARRDRTDERAHGHAPVEDRVRIQEAVRRLPAELREPFVVIEILGYGYEETSVILGVKVGTVKSRMHRARRALIASLSEEATGEV